MLLSLTENSFFIPLVPVTVEKGEAEGVSGF